jgi:hypothetical protein
MTVRGAGRIVVAPANAGWSTKEHPMTAPTSGTTREHRRFRLAGNDNEIVSSMTLGRPFPRVAGEEEDVEGHRLAGNDNEVVSKMTRGQPFPRATGSDDDDQSLPPSSLRR